MSSRMILVDDDRDYMELLAGKLRSIGYHNFVMVDSALEAAEAFERGELFDLALVDMTMPEMDGLAMLEHIKNTSPGTEVIMVTAINEARTAVECLRKGAYDYLVKPVAKDVLALTLPRALERKRLLDILDMEKRQSHPALNDPEPFRPIITQNPTMGRILKEAELHAASNVPVLITGESGTGKELLARAIHSASARADYPFTPINMSSISPNLFEAEFFGHTKGAFTGADSARTGFLEHTNLGTLFLDEIGDLPMELQGKLLRVLQEGEFSKVGSTQRMRVDLRFIAATNEDLDRMMARKAFRKDLFYRIRGGWLHLPPLRVRVNDIPLLLNSFLEKYNEYRRGPRVSPEALERLMEYNWPGNIRELKSTIQSAVNLAQGKRIEIHHLPEHIRTLPKKHTKKRPSAQTAAQPILLLEEVEKAHILNVYGQLNRNKSQTAKALGIGLNTLRRKLAAYGER
ncbi:MAG: sigma-54 dependent transcriptional regulator [Desulfobacteraceae bacterium]|jgi:DNA-binding NtrC family response regulator